MEYYSNSFTCPTCQFWCQGVTSNNSPRDHIFSGRCHQLSCSAHQKQSFRCLLCYPNSNVKTFGYFRYFRSKHSKTRNHVVLCQQNTGRNFCLLPEPVPIIPPIFDDAELYKYSTSGMHNTEHHPNFEHEDQVDHLDTPVRFFENPIEHLEVFEI